MRSLRVLLFLLATLFGVAHATASPTHIAARLVAESEVPAAGSAVTLALVMTPATGWHGYWKNPGDAGVETRAQWSVPPGASAGPLAYPVPGKLLIGGLMNYVYEGPYALLVQLKLPAGLAVGSVAPVRVKLDWLACTDRICVPEKAELATTLRIGNAGVAPDRQAAFDRYRAALPRPLGAQGRFALAGGRLRIAVPLPREADAGEAYFFPAGEGLIDYAAPQQASRTGDTLLIETQGAGAAVDWPIGGVIRIGEGRGLAFTAVPGLVPAAPPASTGAGPHSRGAGAGVLLAALGGAILGGLILNVMPCVFPILGLKALSLARGGGSEWEARREATAYAGGVMLVCLLLGGVLLLLRAGGAAAGWAFQLQDPRAILVLMLLVLAIGFNLAGLFELGGVSAGDRLTRSGGVAGAFWTGALAAFVATPCTGPFMASALGLALTLPAAAALLVFGGLGLGLALPFLLIGFAPALRRRLPRPGPWMERVRRILSVPMFATALGLGWILGRQAGADALTLGLAAALALVLALWWMGARQARLLPIAWGPLVPALALAALGVAAVPLVATKGRVEAAPTAGAERFDEAKLASLRAAGKPVFLYFTADWCLTCKVNEKAAIERSETADAFKRGGVVSMVGDWTDGDPAIGRFLAAHGRSGVPLYLYYRPGAAEPEVLPQILTPGRLAALAT